jgi:hypothetical protein
MTDLPPARILECDPTSYHALPGLSPSLAKVIHARCALIAHDKYERKLEAAEEGDDEDSGDDEKIKPDKQARLDGGSILHALVLGVGKRVDPIPADILSKNGAIGTDKAKAFVAMSRAGGRIPVKADKLEVHQRTATAVRARLASAGHVLDGTSEVAIEWWEPSPNGPVQCRTMMDHLVLVSDAKPTAAFIYELKFPGDAQPDRSERTSDGLGYPIAAAARLRALNALYPSIAGRIEYRFLFCEPHRPYAFWDPTPTGSYLEYGDRVWRRAVHTWSEGLARGRWLDYHDDITRRQIDLPRWRKMAEGFADNE